MWNDVSEVIWEHKKGFLKKIFSTEWNIFYFHILLILFKFFENFLRFLECKQINQKILVMKFIFFDKVTG